MDGLLGPTSSDSSVPIEHLDYGYIGKCSNVPELEKILKILRSGKEGMYPDLISFTEKHIEKLNPNSKVLRKDQPIRKARDLDFNERNEIDNDLENWMSQINNADKSLKSVSHNGVDFSQDGKLPPVRSAKHLDIKEPEEIKPVETKSNKKTKSKKKSTPRDYKEWDKFDIDKVLEEVDKEDSIVQEKTVINTSSHVPVTENIPTSKLSTVEAEWKASQEKDKGNEAFRAGDYEEALVYYNRSIKLHPITAVYNNRAMVEIKLEKYEAALEDCNKVIEQEPDNLKAHLRRATTLKHQGDYREARNSLEFVFSQEPANKRAKELLLELEKAESVSTNQYVKSSETNSNSSPFEKRKRKGQRLKIVEVDGEDSEPQQTNSNNESSEDKNVQNKLEENLETISKTETKNNEKINDSEIMENGNKISLTQISEPQITETKPELSNNHHETSSALVEKPPLVLVKTPTPPSPPPLLPDAVVKLKDSGTDFYQKGQYDKAVEKYSKAIDILCEERSKYLMYLAPLLSNRAAAYNRIGECRHCITDCTQAVEINPLGHKPYLRRAQAYETLEKFKDAYGDFQTVLRLDQQNKSAMEGSTRCMKILKDLHGAKWRDVLNSSTSQPSKPQENQPPPPVTEQVKTTQSTTKTETQELKKPPPPTPPQSKDDKFKLFKEKGNALFAKGNNAEAIGFYTQCIELCPDQLPCYTNRALCYLKLHKYEEALADTISALKLDSRNVKALYRRALAYKGLRKYAESLTTLKTTLIIDPSNTVAKKELTVVQELLNKMKKQKKTAAAKPSPKPEPERRKVIIEEIEDSESEEEEEIVPPQDSKKVKLQDVQPKTENMKKQIPPVAEIPLEKAKNTPPVKPVAPPVIKPSSTKSPRHVDSSKKVKGFEFLQMWNSLKGSDNVGAYADLLRRVELSKLHTVITNKLDADMLGIIFKAITQEFIPKDEIQPSLDILRSLYKAQRFNMVMLFLSDKEKKEIQDMFDQLSPKLPEEQAKEILVLKKKYQS